MSGGRPHSPAYSHTQGQVFHYYSALFVSEVISGPLSQSTRSFMRLLTGPLSLCSPLVYNSLCWQKFFIASSCRGWLSTASVPGFKHQTWSRPHLQWKALVLLLLQDQTAPAPARFWSPRSAGPHL